ncbi:hypothetical protein [Mammaliicoccus sciuri]|uniref:hypothetical protein n=1 Tax=Mammaliicoccus sciuri TaxID=1296 RepID=UPI00301C8537
MLYYSIVVNNSFLYICSKVCKKYKDLLDTAPFTTVLLLNIALMMLNFLAIYDESESMKEEHDLTV